MLETLISIVYAWYCYLAKKPRSYVSRVVSSTRRPPNNSKQLQRRRPQELPTSGRIELDSHADTIVLGYNCEVLHHTGKVCEVSPYSDNYEAIKNVPVVYGATLWTDTVDNQEYILVFNESLWMGNSLTHSLINPDQLHAFGTNVQDNPFSNERLSIQPAFHDIAIPLQTLGTIIYSNTRAPTDHELGQHPHIVLTSPADWDPHHVRFLSHAVEEESRSTINAIQPRLEPNFVGTIDDPATPHLLNGSYHRYKSMTPIWTKRMSHPHTPSVPRRAKQP